MGCGGSAPAEAVSAPPASNGAGNAIKTSSASESRNIDQEIERAKVRKDVVLRYFKPITEDRQFPNDGR